eukprot:714160-Rhodomonas_salina.3
MRSEARVGADLGGNAPDDVVDWQLAVAARQHLVPLGHLQVTARRWYRGRGRDRDRDRDRERRNHNTQREIERERQTETESELGERERGHLGLLLLDVDAVNGRGVERLAQRRHVQAALPSGQHIHTHTHSGPDSDSTTIGP